MVVDRPFPFTKTQRDEAAVPGLEREQTNTFTRIVHGAVFHDAGYGFDVFGLHPPTLARVIEATRPIYELYFRVDSAGANNVPREAAILVANRGGVLPVDAAMLAVDVMRRTKPPRIPRVVADHFVPGLPLVSSLFARLGVVSGTRTNVRHLLEGGELVVIFPEGVTGPPKRYRDRYRIQSWRVDFAELAIRYSVPVVPVAIVGVEESWPLLAKLPARIFKALPIPATPLPLPTRYHIRYGTPCMLAEKPADADNPVLVAAAAAKVRGEVESLVARMVATRQGVFR